MENCQWRSAKIQSKDIYSFWNNLGASNFLSYPVWNLSCLKEVWKSKFSDTGKLRNVLASLFPEKSGLQNNLGVHQKQTKVFFIMAIDDHSSLAFELILQPSALNDKLLSRQKTVNAQGTVFNFSFLQTFQPQAIQDLFPISNRNCHRFLNSQSS